MKVLNFIPRAHMVSEALFLLITKVDKESYGSFVMEFCLITKALEEARLLLPEK